MLEVNIIQESKAVASRIKQLLEQQNISRRDLATKIGVSPQLISSIINEQRNVTIDVLTKLSVFFGVSTDYLLGLSLAEDINTLRKLKKQRAQLEQQTSELHAELVSTPFGDEYNLRLAKLTELAEQIKYLDTCIKRSEETPLKVPVINGTGTVFLPLENMDVDVSLIVDADNVAKLNMPADTILYLKRVDRAETSKLHAVRYGNRLALTTNPNNPTEILGEVSYVLMPGKGYVSMCKQDETADCAQ